MKLILPYPISANRYWRTMVMKGQQHVTTYVSPEAKRYKQQVRIAAYDQGCRRPLRSQVELRIVLVPKNGICMDLDNALKVVIDALKGCAYVDDSQVWKLTAERAAPDGVGGLEVEVLPHVVAPGPLFQSEARAALAASGVEIGAGTPLCIEDEIASGAETDALAALVKKSRQ